VGVRRGGGGQKRACPAKTAGSSQYRPDQQGACKRMKGAKVGSARRKQRWIIQCVKAGRRETTNKDLFCRRNDLPFILNKE
jgi:hypothetical protein